jgi:hypothetical protein
MMCWSDFSLHFTQSPVDSESVAKMWPSKQKRLVKPTASFSRFAAPLECRLITEDVLKVMQLDGIQNRLSDWSEGVLVVSVFGGCRMGIQTCGHARAILVHLLSFVVICCHLCTLSTFSNYIHEWQYMASWCHLQYCGWLGASWYLWGAKTLGCISDWLPQLPSAGAPFEDFALFLLHLYFGSQSSQSLDSFGYEESVSALVWSWLQIQQCSQLLKWLHRCQVLSAVSLVWRKHPISRAFSHIFLGRCCSWTSRLQAGFATHLGTETQEFKEDQRGGFATYHL